MLSIESELEWFQREAEEMQQRYPNAPALPAYLALLSFLFEKRKAELEETCSFVDSIQDERVKEIAWLRLVEGLSYTEIAASMRYSISHVQRIWKPYRELWERVNREKVQTVSGNWRSSCGSMGMRSSAEDR